MITQPKRTVDARLANDTWESLLRTHAVMMRHFSAEDVWGPLTVREYDVLYTLAKAGCTMHPTELNQGVLLSQPALSRLVDRLVTRGLVSRMADPDDGRAVLLALTPAGRELQREVGRRHARSVTARMSAALSDDEMRTMQNLMNKIEKANHDD